MSNKRHLVHIWYDCPIGHYYFKGWINEELNEDGKAVVKPAAVFKAYFGFPIPNYTRVTLI